MTEDRELKDRLQELADKAGIGVPAATRPISHQSRAAKVTGGRQEVTGGTVATFGGWPMVAPGVIDSRTFCNPPRGSNLSMLPMKGGSAAVKGGAGWKLWCVAQCGCDRHKRIRQAGDLGRKTTIQEEVEG